MNEKQPWFELNNELNLPEDGRIRLDKDQEALKLFLEDEVKPKIKRFEKARAREMDGRKRLLR